MLTRRIIPCLDVDAGRVVKGVSFVGLRDAGDPVELAAFYDREGADELVFLDITASAEGRETMVAVVERTAEQVFIPLTVGGGVRSLEDMRRMLEAGADKVAINTAAVEHPDLITAGAERFGCQCIVVAIDARRVDPRPVAQDTGLPSLVSDSGLGTQDSGLVRWQVHTYGGRRPTGLDAVAWAAEACRRGAGEILLTSMDADGHQDGYDVELTRAVGERVPVPVIASGGAGHPSHMYEALTAGQAEAALAASILHYGTWRVRDIKAYLAERGVPVRPVGRAHGRAKGT